MEHTTPKGTTTIIIIIIAITGLTITAVGGSTLAKGNTKDHKITAGITAAKRARIRTIIFININFKRRNIVKTWDIMITRDMTGTMIGQSEIGMIMTGDTRGWIKVGDMIAMSGVMAEQIMVMAMRAASWVEKRNKVDRKIL